jgi:hypothetical protein
VEVILPDLGGIEEYSEPTGRESILNSASLVETLGGQGKQPGGVPRAKKQRDVSRDNQKEPTRQRRRDCGL